MLLALIVFYLVLGMFMDTLSMMVATIPLTFPVVTALGVDPIWFGIFIVLMCELGLITPPVGMNLFVVQGIRPDKGGIDDVILGALPYAVIMILFTLLLIVGAGHRDLAAGQDVTRPREPPCGSCRPPSCSGAIAMEVSRRWQVAQACLARLDAVNPQLNAVVAAAR